MAYHNQPSHHQMHGAFMTGEGDEVGYIEGNYVPTMHGVAPAMVNGQDESLLTPQVGHEGRPSSSGFPNHQQGASYHVPGPSSQYQGSVQQYSRPSQPLAGSHGGRNLNSHGDVRSNPYNGYQQGLTPNAFSSVGDTYPTPPIAWHNDLNPPSQNTYEHTRPSASGNYGVDYPATTFAGHNPSLYAANAPNLNAYPWPPGKARPTGKPLQAQPSAGKKRRSPVSAVGDELEDEEVLSEGEGNGEADEEEHSVMAKGGKKSKKASKVKKEVRRGLTRVNADGELEWLATASSKGVLAVTHDEIRPQLIAIAEAERIALGIQNDFPDAPGLGKYNVTSFYRKHIHWGQERENRPEIDFAWEEDQENNPRPQCPGHMYYEENGKKYVVLDPHDNPVKGWDMPATIASNIPGYKLEAIRRENMSIGHKDFWARMPRQINVGTEDRPIWEKLGDPNSTVNMPMERFRFHAGLCSWTKRTKTLIIKEGLEKLYGDKIQNNSVRAFGRDLTTREIKEIKKGDKAIFPIKGDATPAARRTAIKNGNKGAAKPTKPTANAKTRSGKRKHVTDDEVGSSDEEAQTQARFYKRARHASKEDSIGDEVEDLVMFEQPPAILDQADATGRYSLRSTRKDGTAPPTTKAVEESSIESSADEEYEDVPTQRYSPRKLSRSSDRLDESSCESSTETDDEETAVPRVPLRRIPGAGDICGKSKGPSWVNSTRKNEQSYNEKGHRRTAVPVTIDGKVHYATYEGLISNEPAHSVGGSDISPQGQAPKVNSASFAQNESYGPQPYAFDVMMKMPLFEEKSLQEEDTPLQTHRKRARELLGDDEADAYAPSSKRLRTEQPGLPIPGAAIHGASGKVQLQVVLQPIVPPPAMSPQIDSSSRTPPAPHAQPPQTRNQMLDAEWAHVFEQTFKDLGFQSVNYSEVPPWNDEEVQSLIDALLPTREVYFAWTKEPAPRTDPHQSYRQQFDTIFSSFQEWWRRNRSDEPLPILVGVMHFGRSVDDWEPPSKDSIYYEAFREGYRALPGDWPNSRLEDAFRKGMSKKRVRYSSGSGIRQVGDIVDFKSKS